MKWFFEKKRCSVNLGFTKKSKMKILVYTRNFLPDMGGLERNTFTLASSLTAKLEAATGELKSLNASWESAPAVGQDSRAETLPLDQLERIFRTVSFVSRWLAQLRERVIRLAI